MIVPPPAVLTGHTAAVYALARWRGGVLSGGGDGRLAYWAPPYSTGGSPADGKLVAELDDRIFCIEAPGGDHDGQLVLGTLTGDLYWVDVNATAAPRRWRLHRDGLFGLCVAGEHVFAVGGGGRLSRWRLADGGAEGSVAVDTVRLRSVAALPGAGLLVVGTAAGDLHLVDPASLRTVDVYERAHDNTIFEIAVADASADGGPDPGEGTDPGEGARLYTCGRDGAIRSWTWAGGALRQNGHAPAHAATVNALALGGPGLLASAGRDREVRLWDVSDGRLVLAKALQAQRDRGHAHSVNACRWVGPGTLATAGDDRTVRVWQVPTYLRSPP